MAAIAGDRDPPFGGEFLRPNGYGILWINYVVAGAVGADVAAITAVVFFLFYFGRTSTR